MLRTQAKLDRGKELVIRESQRRKLSGTKSEMAAVANVESRRSNLDGTFSTDLFCLQKNEVSWSS